MLRFYIYIHRRPDTGDAFYVGRGMLYGNSTFPRRAHDTRRRNSQWNSIVRRNDGLFDVEIAEWHGSLASVLIAEQEFIKKFGKQIDGTGSLINLTDGGDGSLGLKHSTETKARLSEKWKNNEQRIAFLRSAEFKVMRREKMREFPGSMKGKQHKPETIDQMRRSRSGGGNVNAKRIVDHATGQIFPCVEDAAKAKGIGKWSLYKALSGERKNHTSLRYA